MCNDCNTNLRLAPTHATIEQPFLPENIFNLQSKINNFLFKLYKIRNNKIIFQKIKKIPRNLNGKITYSNLPN